MSAEQTSFSNADTKVGFHQSYSVTARLGKLQDDLNNCFIYNNLHRARHILEEIESAISVKLRPEEEEELDKIKYDKNEGIDMLFRIAKFNKSNQTTYFQNESVIWTLRKKMIKYDRKLKKLQMKYGFYMMEEDDPRKAVLKR